MKKFILLASVAVLALGITSEAGAACNSGDFSCNGQTGETAYCCYHIISQDEKGNNQSIEIYKDLSAPSGVEASVGTKAFYRNSKIKSVDVKQGITAIGRDAFWAATKLESITMPYVKTLGSTAFNGAQSLKSLDMPSIQSFEWVIFRGELDYIGVPSNINLNGYFPKIPECMIVKGYKICGSCGKQYAKRGTGCVDDCGDGLLGKEGQCIDASLGCGEGYKNMGRFCNRVRYTPAEAAKVLNEDNNTVTLTFKKQ